MSLSAAVLSGRHKQLLDTLQADLHTLANEAKKKSPAVKLVGGRKREG